MLNFELYSVYNNFIIHLIQKPIFKEITNCRFCKTNPSRFLLHAHVLRFPIHMSHIKNFKSSFEAKEIGKISRSNKIEHNFQGSYDIDPES